jgi:hypothetical protein
MMRYRQTLAEEIGYATNSLMESIDNYKAAAV